MNMQKVNISKFQKQLYDCIKDLPLAVTVDGNIVFYVLKDLPPELKSNPDYIPNDLIVSNILDQLEKKARKQEKQSVQIAINSPEADQPQEPLDKSKIIDELNRETISKPESQSSKQDIPSQSIPRPPDAQCQVNELNPNATCLDPPIGKYSVVIHFEAKEIYLCKNHVDQANANNLGVYELVLFH